MNNGYFGEPNMGNHHHESRGNGSSSSRKGKKGSSSSSEKPKQPQRGLGVAQLEKIRLTSQLAAGSCTTTTTNHNNSYHQASFHSAYPSSNFNYQEDIRGGGQAAAYSSLPSSSFSYSSSSSLPSYGYNPNIMMGVGDYERANMGYGDSQPSTVPSWNLGNGIYETTHQHSFQPGATKHLFNLHDQTTSTGKKHRSDSIGSSSQNSESNDSQELDLELRLSL